MEENMSDDFIIEEESDGAANRRPFLVAVGALVTIFILASVCALGLLLSNRSSDRAQEIAAIETQNAVIAITNEAVTLTIAAIETEAARPTDTPQPTATSTSTPVPTDTPLPTNTRVIQPADEGTQTPSITGTTIFGDGAGVSTPTPIIASGGDGALPQTGINTWGALVVAAILIVTVVTARRLRSS
jgi:hypothetical protein